MVMFALFFFFGRSQILAVVTLVVCVVLAFGPLQ